MFYMLYRFATFKTTEFDPVTNTEVPILMLHQNTESLEEGLRGKVLTEYARRKIENDTNYYEAKNMFEESELESSIAS